MGAAPVRSVRSKRLLLAAVIACSCLALSVSASAADTGGSVDRLWTQPEGLKVDSAFYVVEAWWGGLSRARQGDLRQRALDQLRQGNSDLLNAYSLLVEERSDPGPHPVAVIDPLLSGLYSIVTGEHPKAPLGSFFGWINKQLNKLEGRGSSEAIVDQLLRDYRSMQAAADADFWASGASGADGLWAANAERGKAVLARIRGLGIKSDSLNAALNVSDQVRTALLKKHPEKPIAGAGVEPAKSKTQVGGPQPKTTGDRD